LIDAYLSVEDNVMAEARNLRNMINTQTPLLGDENTPLHEREGGGTGFEGATPRHVVSSTPNPLATPFRGSNGVDFGATPRSEAGSVSTTATPLRTPMRDSLNINDGSMTPIGDTPAQARRRAKDALRRGFAGLPSAQNNFEVEAPEDEEPEEQEEVELSEEDAAERDAKLEKARKEEEEKALLRRSMAVQKGLPRPVNVDLDRLLHELDLSFTPSGDDTLDSAARLVDVEFAHLLQHDSLAHPLPGTSHSGASSSSFSKYTPPDDDNLSTARTLVHAELATAIGFPGANPDQVKRGILSHLADTNQDVDALSSSLSWARTRETLVFSASSSTWVDPSSTSSTDRIAGYSSLLEQDRELMMAEAVKASKIEKKLAKTLGGYQAVNAKLRTRIETAFAELQSTKVELEVFERLRTAEEGSKVGRVEGLEREVAKLTRREGELQERYRELDEERRERGERVRKSEEERMIEEAERALDAMQDAEMADNGQDETGAPAETLAA
jgi:pre-mRNA-splicing factor CDC5/CEF1